MKPEIRLPLLDHLLEDATAFRPEALLDAVRAEKGLAAEPAPAVCLLDFDGDITDWMAATGRAKRWDSWACFHTPMYTIEVDGARAGIVPRTIGGPYAVLVAEQLAASGAKVVLGLTSAGRVSPTLPVPSLVLATRAVRDEGTSYHYLAAGVTVDAPAGIIPLLREELEHAGRPLAEGTVWTTDAPYRETRGQLERHAAAGVLAVEMQAASLFAFAAAKGTPVGVVAQVTNAPGQAVDPFDKGTHEDEYRLVLAMCRAGGRCARGGREGSSAA